jgi:hypothetical protein
MQLVDYSEHAIAVYGDDVHAFHDRWIQAGGRYCINLKAIAEGLSGYVFSKKRQAQIVEVMNNLGDAPEGEVHMAPYSDKSIAVYGGSVHRYHDFWVAANGRYCPNLKAIGEGLTGYVFSVKRTEQVTQLVNQLH